MSSRGRSLAQEGFIHASTQAQVGGVLRSFYADLERLELLVLDIAELAAAGSLVRWDDVPGQPAPFPHIYGPIPTPVVGPGSPVIAVRRMERAPGADWAVPDLSAYDVATGPARDSAT